MRTNATNRQGSMTGYFSSWISPMDAVNLLPDITQAQIKSISQQFKKVRLTPCISLHSLILTSIIYESIENQKANNLEIIKDVIPVFQMQRDGIDLVNGQSNLKNLLQSIIDLIKRSQRIEEAYYLQLLTNFQIQSVLEFTFKALLKHQKSEEGICKLFKISLWVRYEPNNTVNQIPAIKPEMKIQLLVYNKSKFFFGKLHSDQISTPPASQYNSVVKHQGLPAASLNNYTTFQQQEPASLKQDQYNQQQQQQYQYQLQQQQQQQYEYQKQQQQQQQKGYPQFKQQYPQYQQQGQMQQQQQPQQMKGPTQNQAMQQQYDNMKGNIFSPQKYPAMNATQSQQSSREAGFIQETTIPKLPSTIQSQNKVEYPQFASQIHSNNDSGSYQMNVPYIRQADQEPDSQSKKLKPQQQYQQESQIDKACVICQKVIGDKNQLYTNPTCKHTFCIHCLQKISIPDHLIVNCFNRSCYATVNTEEMTAYFISNQSSQTSSHGQNYNLICAYCKASTILQLDKKPEYFKCPNCARTSCLLHKEQTQLESCYCLCPKCLSGIVQQGKMKQCLKCKSCKCTQCFKIYQTIQICQCKCPICQKQLQFKNETKNDCSCECMQENCSVCLVSLDFNTLKKKNYACQKHQICNSCSYSLLNKMQKIQCLFCQAV